MESSRVQATWLMELVGGARRRLRAFAAAASSTGHDSTREFTHMLLIARPFRCLLHICTCPGKVPVMARDGYLLTAGSSQKTEHSETGDAAHPDAAILCAGGDALTIVAELQQKHIVPMPLQPTELCGRWQARK